MLAYTKLWFSLVGERAPGAGVHLSSPRGVPSREICLLVSVYVLVHVPLGWVLWSTGHGTLHMKPCLRAAFSSCHFCLNVVYVLFIAQKWNFVLCVFS